MPLKLNSCQLLTVNVFTEDNIVFQELRNDSDYDYVLRSCLHWSVKLLFGNHAMRFTVSCSCSRPVWWQCLYGPKDGSTGDCSCCHLLVQSVNKSFTLVGITAYCSLCFQNLCYSWLLAVESLTIDFEFLLIPVKELNFRKRFRLSRESLKHSYNAMSFDCFRPCDTFCFRRYAYGAEHYWGKHARTP